jgi:ribosomal-protein-alanine N-acetyltransferase
LNTKTSWRIIPFTEKHGQEICVWKYPAPYDLYNWPAWEYMLKEEHEFADPALRAEQYRAVVDDAGRLIGFVQFFPIVGVTRLGLGLRPELCGQGLGEAFVRLIVQAALQQTPDSEIDLEVLTWNERATATYKKAGFVISDTYERMTPSGIGQFHCMVYSDKP